ncbi:hypothetical protein [Yersinia enterocolitica]|uniref:hypothetical protein n=1 Tax=Yersinia enterocolitica TaxID=630 RepID=UPI00365D13BB
MSKIARYAGNLRAFGSNAQGSERTLFGETTQADDLTSQITASFLRGWGVVGPSENPSLEDFNAAMYTMSQFIAYQHQMGVPEWDSRQEYYVGSICVHDGDSYISLADGNTNSKPPSAKWTTVLTAKNALANITGFLKAKNNLSEIKDAGPEAVAQTLANLGLDDVIRKSDTNVQLPGQLTTKGNIKSTEGDLYSGDARLAHDGNIFGTVWGDSLFHYLEGKLPKVTTVYINAGTPESPYQYPVRSRQTFGNPFPGRIIECKAELFINNIWGPTGFIYSSDNSWGVTASPFDNSARIVVQSGRTGTAAISENAGGVHGISNNVNSPLPIRLKVWTVD